MNPHEVHMYICLVLASIRSAEPYIGATLARCASTARRPTVS